MPDVKIIQPSKKVKKLPKTFLAQGFAKGARVGTVKATLTDVTGGANINVATVYLAHFSQCPFRGRPGRNRFRWQFLCVNVTAQVAVRDFELKVEAIRAADGVAIAEQTVEFQVDPNLTAQAGPPTYTYPEPDHEITGPELDMFVPFGFSNINISSVKIGSRDADGTHWLPGPNFWWAEFNHLNMNPGGGDYGMIVANKDGLAETDVTVDAPPPPPPPPPPPGP